MEFYRYVPYITAYMDVIDLVLMYTHINLHFFFVLQKDNDDLLKLVAKEWRKISARDRAYWDEEARNDKVSPLL